MLNITFEQLNNAQFELYERNPVITHGAGSPIVADPSVLTPDLTPDGKWHLFAHTLFGVYDFLSDDGIDFPVRRKILSRAMRPCAAFEGGVYYIFYERLQSAPARAAGLFGGKWKSEIFVVESRDLVNYSSPRPVLRFDKDFERAGRGYSLSNPFLLADGDKFRLYYSAGLTYVPDCGFSEPTYICLAQSDSPAECYVKLDEPVMSPSGKGGGSDLGCGCVKVYRLADCYAALQNGIYSEGGRSRSAIRLLRSADGVHFEFAKVLLRPRVVDGNEWMAQFVYASHLVRYGDELRLYFNARNTANMLAGRENIGFAHARVGGATD